MIKFKTKPKTVSFYLAGFELTKINKKWHTVHFDGYDYYVLLVDARSVYGAAKKSGKLEEYKQFNSN